MLSEGKYSVWFKTARAQGAGVIELGLDGILSGGDGCFSYSGKWEQDEHQFRANIQSKRVAVGTSVFGLDQVDISVAGTSNSKTASCTGTAKQAPDLKLEVIMIRMKD